MSFLGKEAAKLERTDKERGCQPKKKKYFFRIWSLIPFKSILVMHS